MLLKSPSACFSDSGPPSPDYLVEKQRAPVCVLGPGLAVAHGKYFSGQFSLLSGQGERSLAPNCWPRSPAAQQLKLAHFLSPGVGFHKVAFWLVYSRGGGQFGGDVVSGGLMPWGTLCSCLWEVTMADVGDSGKASESETCWSWCLMLWWCW